MLSAETAISRLRLHLTLSAVVKGLLLVVFFGSMLPMVLPNVERTVVWVVLGIVWLALAFASSKGSRAAADSPRLIATGQFDEAERSIEQALRSFSLFRAAKLQSLHHLAVLRHAQKRWNEAAVLSRELIGLRLGPLQPLAKPSRLLLADAMLEMGNLPGAQEAIAGLYAQRLSLSEVTSLLLVQLDYESRVGAWQRMTENVMHKVQLAELMPPVQSARAQGLLALAATRIGRQDLSDWLRRRAELLAETSKLTTDRPVLRELWP